MSTLTDEQRRLIEEKRQKALNLRLSKLSQQGLGTSAGNSSLPSNSVVRDEPGSVPSNQFSGLSQFRNTKIASTGRKSDISLLLSPVGAKRSKQDQPSSFEGFNLTKTEFGKCRMISRKCFVVDCGYNAKLIEIFKSIPSRSYDALEKKWSFGIQDHNKLVESIKVLKPEVSIAPLPSYVLKIFLNAPETFAIPDVDLSFIDKKLVSSLFLFQTEGIKFGIHLNGCVLIADDMGLGKTIQALGLCCYYKDSWPLLIVCPSSMRYSWKHSIKQWLSFSDNLNIGVICSGKDSPQGCDVVIVSFDLLQRRSAEFSALKFKIVVIDESHFLKNFKSARSQAAKEIFKHASYRILLSGTPALSRPMELFNQIKAVNPKLFSSFQEFGIRYCGGKKTAYGWDYSGATNMSELQLILEEKVMIRRLKSEVLSQLPDKTRQMILLDPDAVKSTKQMRAFAHKMDCTNLNGMEKRGILLTYYCETAKVKAKAVCDYISDLLESDKKFICFAHHEYMMNTIASLLEKKDVQFVRIDGSTTPEQRKHYCDKFQVSEIVRVALLSITAANSGITLTATHLVLFAELYWNPGILTQAEDRAHRIGQNDSVLVQYLVAKGTADDLLWPLVQKKLQILNRVGLSKDTFSDANTTCHKTKSGQPSVEDWLDHTDAELDMILSQECDAIDWDNPM